MIVSKLLECELAICCIDSFTLQFQKYERVYTTYKVWLAYYMPYIRRVFIVVRSIDYAT